MHHVSATAGVNYETKFFKDIKIQRNDLLSEDLTDFNLANGDEMSIAGGKNRYALFGLFYRLNYDYKNRYSEAPYGLPLHDNMIHGEVISMEN